MRGYVQGTFEFKIYCNLKKYIDDELENEISNLKDEILDIVGGNIDAELLDDSDIDIDTDESFIIYGEYSLIGTYSSYEGDRENPPEFDSEYPTIKEKKILKALQNKFTEYDFKVDFDEYPDEEEIIQY